MKKFFVLFLMVCLMLTGCSKATKTPQELPDDPIDTSGKKVVLYCGKNIIPLSYIIDGEQQIQNGSYWYYELEQPLLKSNDEKLYIYDELSLDLNGVETMDTLQCENSFFTNGGWPLFLSPVHTQYTESNQSDLDDKIKRLADAQLVANQINDKSAKITDLWKCDLDQDGEEEVLFLAKDEAEEGRYCFLGYVNGEDCQILSAFYGLEKLPEIRPIVCDFEGDGKWSVMLYETCHYRKFTTLDFKNGTFTKAYDIIF